MSFNFVWYRKKNLKLVKGEFLKFLRYHKFSYIRRRNRKAKYFRKFLKLKKRKFFNFVNIGLYSRIRSKNAIKGFNLFYSVFFWVRFLSNNFTVNSTLFLFPRFSNKNFINNSPSSRLFFPLTKLNIRHPRATKLVTKRYRVSRVVVRNRRLQAKLHFFEYAVLVFFFRSFLNQIYYTGNLNFVNEYFLFLNFIFLNFVKYWFSLYCFMVRFGYRFNLKKKNSLSKVSYYKIYSFNNFFRFTSVVGKFDAFFNLKNGFKVANFQFLKSVFLNNNFYYVDVKIFYFYLVTLFLSATYNKNNVLYFVSRFIYKSL